MAQTLSQTPNIRSDPKFLKTLVGDFTFDLDCARSRCPPFLLRNIRHLLSYHQKSLQQHVVGALDPTSDRTVDAESCSCADPSSCSHSNEGRLAAAHASNHQRCRPIRLGSVVSLPIRDMDTPESASRRSTRKLQEQMYDNDYAELTINLSNIRKLLNFKLNRPGEDERPRKRVKKDYYKCQCSLTIWDNRPNLDTNDSIVRKSAFCTLTSIDNGVYGPCVLIDLDKPFVVQAKDLKVPTDRNGEAQLEIVDNYFMEIKIIPTRPDVNWPPIPILGKSDGDHYSGPGRLPSEALAGALVMKHKELPKAPDSTTPLKAFFLYNGVTFKTKYGLEVSAQWKRPEASSKDLVAAQYSVEKVIGHDAPKKNPAAPKQPISKDRLQSAVPASDLSVGENVKRRRRKIKVIYHFEPVTVRTQDVLKQYRTAEVNGLVCPACPTFKATVLQELRFHFLSSHHKYNFALGQTIEDEATGELQEVVFEVTPVPIPKPTSRLIKHEQEFEWVVRATPFDLAAFLEGDTSWLGAMGDETKIPVRRALPVPVSEVKLVPDPVSQRRLQNNGFLPTEEVRDFRKTNRKKHQLVKLVRRVDNKVATYNSISHRQTYPSEEPMSDTDDEVEDEWFIQRHLENLDIAAREDSWDPMRRELFRRWDTHRLEEKLENTRFLSDSLVRFVRKEKMWLAGSDENRRAAFRQLLGELVKSRFINAQVAADIQRMVSDAKISSAANLTENEIGMATETLQRSNHQLSAGVTAELSEPDVLFDHRIRLSKYFQLLRSNEKVQLRDILAQRGLTDSQFAVVKDLGYSRDQVNAVFMRWNAEFRTNNVSLLGTAPVSKPTNPPSIVASDKSDTNGLSPEQELLAYRNTLLAQPPGHCGACSNPILKQITEGIHCSSPACATPSAWYHLKCVKLKKRRVDWMCRGCRAETKLRATREQQRKGKAKGKERAVE